MPLTFSITRRIAFAETDMAGIVHFSNFFRMMEDVEHAFFRSHGLSVCMEFEGKQIGWPRVSAKCDYIGPVRFEDELELRLRVGRIGDKSFTYEVEFFCKDRKVAVGSATSVCCEVMGDGKMTSILIPPAIREKLSAD
jgi:YbgC/YbaW family acyl-CoA thioester hydrolase